MKSARVRLRPVNASDTDCILRWRSDPDVASQLFSERPPTREQHERWVAALNGSSERKEFLILALPQEMPIGTVGLSGIDPDRKTAEYGILIGDPDYRGKGYAREASRLILDYAFATLDLDEIYLNLFADNLRARELYALLGFEEDPSNEGRKIKDSVPRATSCMRLRRSRWMLRAD